MMKTKEKLRLDQSLFKNRFYNTFVLLQLIEQNAMMHDTKVELHHKIIPTTYTIIHKTDIVLHIEIDLIIIKVLLLHTTLDQDMTTIKETRDLIALFIDPHTDHFIEATFVTDIDHAHIQEIITILQHIHLLLHHL